MNTVDILGAGDVYHGMYSYFKYVKELEFSEALTQAMHVAATSTTVYGVVNGVKEYVNSFNHK